MRILIAANYEKKLLFSAQIIPFYEDGNICINNLKIHGNEIFENVFNFYSVVDKFFASKKIGGIIVIAKKL